MAMVCEFFCLSNHIKKCSYAISLQGRRKSVRKSSIRAVVIEADVFAHFDYGVRVFGLSVAEFKQYEAEFLPIIDQVIKNKLAFELNAKSAYLYDNLALYEYVIDLYISRGDTLFSVGSDGYYLEHFRFHFDDLFALSKAKGVTKLAIYQKGKRIMVPLPV